MPADLEPLSDVDVAQSVVWDGTLKAAATTRLSFDLHWLREIAAGTLVGGRGVAVDGGADVSLTLSVAGSFRTSVTLEQERGLRVRVFQQSDSTPSLRVSAQTPDPENPERLVLAILGVHGLGQFSLARIQQALGSLAAFDSLDGWLKKRLSDFLGDIGSASDLASALRNLGAVVDLARSVRGRAPAALEKKYSAELSYHCQHAESGAALLDCSFDDTPEGLGACRAALAGDFSLRPARHVLVHRAALSHGLSPQVHLELHLPFLDRKHWRRRWEALARVEVETSEDGRLFACLHEAAYRGEKESTYQSRLALAGNLLAGGQARFTLSFTDRRSLSAAQARATLPALLHGYGFERLGEASWCGSVQAALTLSLPGELMAAWLRAPRERAPSFFAVYSAVSIAVQNALRRWLPYVYFSDLDRYDNLGAALPLIVYQTMRPFPGRACSEFTYEVISPGHPLFEHPCAAHALGRELSRIRQLLIAEGRMSTARLYQREQARSVLAGVQRHPRMLNALLAADAFVVESLVGLGVRCHELGDALPHEPRESAAALAKFSARFITLFHRRLRRLYAGQSFVALGSLLLLEATGALAAALNHDARVAGILRLTLGPRQQTILNAAFQPDYRDFSFPPMHLP